MNQFVRSFPLMVPISHFLVHVRDSVDQYNLGLAHGLAERKRRGPSGR